MGLFLRKGGGDEWMDGWMSEKDFNSVELYSDGLLFVCFVS